MASKNKLVIITVLIGFLTFLDSSVQADPLADEYRIKAAFLYNFAQFVEWPQGPFKGEGTPYVFAIISGDSSPNWGAEIEKRTIRGHRIVVRYLQTLQELDEQYQVLFIHRSMEKESRRIIERLKDRPVLLVGDEIDLARAGGTINFIRIDNKIRFEVNIDVARRTDLLISSELLKLGSIVTTENIRN